MERLTEHLEDSEQGAPPGYSVQVGAYRKLEHAEKAVADLISRGFDAHSHLGRSKGQEVHRVWVGRYPTRDEARQAVEALQESGIFSYVVEDDSR
jgi:cell division protein FtsN